MASFCLKYLYLDFESNNFHDICENIKNSLSDDFVVSHSERVMLIVLQKRRLFTHGVDTLSSLIGTHVKCIKEKSVCMCKPFYEKHCQGKNVVYYGRAKHILEKKMLCINELPTLSKNIVLKLDKEMLKRHYYIYSEKVDNWMSKYASKIVSTENASYVRSLSNWQSVKENVNFLVFEEYCTARRLPLHVLFLLTSGNGNSFEGRKIGSSTSYIPRNDVQLVIFSNYHPSCIYKHMTDHDWLKFESRFFIINMKKL